MGPAPPIRVAIVVVCDFDFVGITILPAKADSVLVIDADAVLAFAVAAQRLEPIAGRHGEFPQIAHSIQLGQLPANDRPQHFGARSAGTRTRDAVEQILRSGVGE